MFQRRATVTAYLALSIILIGLSAVLRPIVLPTESERVSRGLIHSIEARDPTALAQSLQYVNDHPDDSNCIALAAEAAATAYEHQQSIELYRRLPRDGGKWQFLAEYGQGKRYEATGRISVAERHYRNALQLNPRHLDTNLRLGHILLCSGRSWEAGPCFFSAIQQGRCNGDILLGMAYADRFFRRDERFEMVGLALDPPEPLMQLSTARRAINENQLATAQVLLEEVVKVRPDLGEAQGRLGRMISDQGNQTNFEKWRLGLTPEAMNHPEVLFVLGLHASRQGHSAGAVRCFLEVLKRSPNHLATTIQLASCLERLGFTIHATRCSERGQLLAQLESNLNVVRSDLVEKNLYDMVKEQQQLGRFWEAAGWCYVMQWISVEQDFPKSTFQQVQPLAYCELEATANEYRPERLLPISHFPWPNWSTTPEVESPISPQGSPHNWELENVAQSSGIDFEYIEGTSEETRLNHIFSTVGGGLGAFDFDRDGWCDLYLPQANDWRNNTPQPQLHDRLYRNNGHGNFKQVTSNAGILETGFSHGVAIGDINQDGFSDIYVCNKGLNRLYQNLGDGTFEDVTAAFQIGGNSEDWSTSAVFADFDGDSAPDLYVLNYSPVTPTAEKICRRDDGTQVACTPGELPSAVDRFYINQRDGTFRDATSESELVDPNGRGLGVIAWNFGDNRRLGLFVSNDTTANYLFVNEGTGSQGTPRFREEGIVRGVAFDADGNAQASMGVAASDANHDGELELFVTNFFNESNTYYSCEADGYFSDQTRTANLRDASYKMLGFGCQFADLNCDGWPDLIATNGHVDQLVSDGSMDRMPPQVYSNHAGQRFEEIPSSSLGPFFQGRYLGRGMAIADWDRDGRADVGISHLHGQFALLSHNDSDASLFTTTPLTIRLVGTLSCREPTGASVRISSQNWFSTSLQTGGSGYLATNEPLHQFHVPPEIQSVNATVTWPDGRQQTWDNLSVGRETMLVEFDPLARELRYLNRSPSDSN